MSTASFVEDLHQLLHTWGYPEWQVQEVLPRIVRVFEGVGILRRFDDDVYLVTEFADDDPSWDRVWELLEKEGIAGGQGPAY